MLLSLDSQKKKKEKGNKCLNAVVKIDFFFKKIIINQLFGFSHI